MAKKKGKTLIINDEDQANSYGFKILTAGIGLVRFLKNPIMLADHRNSLDAILGEFSELNTQKNLLLGLPSFDSESETTAEIERKYNKGFIKSCSMGIQFDRDALQIIDGELVLTECELMEVSLVAIPSNANAVRLYAADSKEPLTETEIQKLCLSVQPATDSLEVDPSKSKNKKMTKIKLTAANALALGYAEGTTEVDPEVLVAKTIALSAKNAVQKAALDTATLELTAIKSANETAKLTAITTEVDAAITKGQITADNKEQFVNLGVANSELLTSTLAAIPVKKSLAASVSGKPAETGEVKTKADFMKLDEAAMLSFKAENPDQYKKLFIQK